MRSLVRSSILELSTLGVTVTAVAVAARLGVVPGDWDPAVAAFVIFTLWLGVCALIYRVFFR